MMTSADLHNDKLAVEKKEKLEWVTPKISLMEAGDSAGKTNSQAEFQGSPPVSLFHWPFLIHHCATNPNRP